MKSWQAFCEVEDFLETYSADFDSNKRDKDKHCGFQRRVAPKPFLDHVRSKADKGCVVHGVILEYLRVAFLQYRGEHLRHEAFENPNSKAYLKTTKIVRENIRK